MPTVMNLNEAKTNFSSIVSNVEKNSVTVTIMRYGHPVARLVPIEKKRRELKAVPGCEGKVKVKFDLFGDDSELWEACHDESAPA